MMVVCLESSVGGPLGLPFSFLQGTVGKLAGDVVESKAVHVRGCLHGEFKDMGLYYRKYGENQLLFLGNTVIELRRLYVLMFDAATDTIELTYDQKFGGICRGTIGKAKSGCVGTELFEFYEWLKERLLAAGHGMLVEAKRPWTHVDKRLQEFKDTGLFYGKLDGYHTLFLVDRVQRLEVLFMMQYVVESNELHLTFKQSSMSEVETMRLKEPAKERIAEFHMFEFYEWLRERLLPEAARSVEEESKELEENQDLLEDAKQCREATKDMLRKLKEESLK